MFMWIVQIMIVVCFLDRVGRNFKFLELGCIFHINNKELIAAIIALELSQLSGATCSVLYVDNTAVVSWLRKHCDVG